MHRSNKHDFDFLAGHWRVRHRRLRERLAGSDEWQEFDGTCSMRVILGGKANVDDNVLNLPGGAYRAASLRAFDRDTRTWAIWWLDDRNPHVMDVPVKGAFAGGVGTFCADDTLNGQPIRVRFRWTDTRSAALGAGVLPRRRRDVGSQLDHGVHARRTEKLIDDCLPWVDGKLWCAFAADSSWPISSLHGHRLQRRLGRAAASWRRDHGRQPSLPTRCSPSPRRTGRWGGYGRTGSSLKRMRNPLSLGA
jgi:hypothetical protein